MKSFGFWADVLVLCVYACKLPILLLRSNTRPFILCPITRTAIVSQDHDLRICDQQATSFPIPSPSMPSTLYLALVPWLRAWQSSVSLPQQVSQKVLVATVFQRAQVFLPVASVLTTQQAPKLGLKTDWLKVMNTKSLPGQQCSKQRHLRSQQFQARSERGAPVLTTDFWAVYQQSWVLRKLAEAAARSATRTIRVLFISI